MFVYCLIYQNRSYFKLGVTHSPPLWRLRVIERKSPHEIKMNFFFPVKDRRIEKKILDLLVDFRIGNTEWFEGSNLQSAIDVMKKFYQPNIAYNNRCFDVLYKTQVLEECFYNKSASSIDGMKNYLKEIFT